VSDRQGVSTRDLVKKEMVGIITLKTGKGHLGNDYDGDTSKLLILVSLSLLQRVYL
jgi:hypothetical protein